MPSRKPGTVSRIWRCPAAGVFGFIQSELAFAVSRPALHAQIYCVLQIGYFKAKHAFFRFDWSDVEDDCAFVLSRYFAGESFERKEIIKHEHSASANGLPSCSATAVGSRLPAEARAQAAHIVRRDVPPRECRFLSALTPLQSIAVRPCRRHCRPRH